MLSSNHEVTFKRLVIDLGVTRAQALLNEVSRLVAGFSGDEEGENHVPVKVRGGRTVHIAKGVLTLTGLLSKQPGLRAEQIRAKLRWDKKTLTKAITTALAEKRIKKTGQKRATRYYYAR